MLVLSTTHEPGWFVDPKLIVFELPGGIIRAKFCLPFAKTLYGPLLIRDNFQADGSCYDQGYPYIYHPGNDRVIVMSVGIGPGHDPITVVISVSHLLSRIPSVGIPAATIDWYTWGLEATRWFEGRLTSAALCGSLFWFTIDDHDTSFLLDFNQRAISRQKFRSGIENVENHSVEERKIHSARPLSRRSRNGEKKQNQGRTRNGTGSSESTNLGERINVTTSKMPDKRENSPKKWMLRMAEEKGTHLITEDWVLDASTTSFSHGSSSSDDEIDIMPFGSEPRSLKCDVHCQLPFRAFIKRYPDELRESSIYLGIWELFEVKVSNSS